MTNYNIIKNLRRDIDRLNQEVKRRIAFDDAQSEGAIAYLDGQPFSANPYRDRQTQLGQACAVLWDFAYIEAAESDMLHLLLTHLQQCDSCEGDNTWCAECDGHGINVNFQAVSEALTEINKFRDEVDEIYDSQNN